MTRAAAWQAALVAQKARGYISPGGRTHPLYRGEDRAATTGEPCVAAADLPSQRSPDACVCSTLRARIQRDGFCAAEIRCTPSRPNICTISITTRGGGERARTCVAVDAAGERARPRRVRSDWTAVGYTASRGAVGAARSNGTGRRRRRRRRKKKRPRRCWLLAPWDRGSSASPRPRRAAPRRETDAPELGRAGVGADAVGRTSRRKQEVQLVSPVGRALT